MTKREKIKEPLQAWRWEGRLGRNLRNNVWMRPFWVRENLSSSDVSVQRILDSTPWILVCCFQKTSSFCVIGAQQFWAQHANGHSLGMTVSLHSLPQSRGEVLTAHMSPSPPGPGTRNCPHGPAWCRRRESGWRICGRKQEPVRAWRSQTAAASSHPGTISGMTVKTTRQTGRKLEALKSFKAMRLNCFAIYCNNMSEKVRNVNRDTRTGVKFGSTWCLDMLPGRSECD